MRDDEIISIHPMSFDTVRHFGPYFWVERIRESVPPSVADALAGVTP